MLELIQFEQTEKVTSTGMGFSFIADKPLTELKEEHRIWGITLPTLYLNRRSWLISQSPTLMD